MSAARGRTASYWPRHGIMATEAGRHVVVSILWLTALSFALAAVLVSATVVGAEALGWIAPHSEVHLLEGILGSIGVLALAFALLPALGRLTRFGDEVRLLELCDPGAPLLQELMERAPGTYNHSIVAGSMAEAAAREIGANALLARVGAYYHDVGKIARPQFFVENQLGLLNPHDAAPPQQSAMVITAHVRDGVRMAEAAKLPRAVIDIIAEHHGTSLVAYFYGKAASGGVAVDQAPFRYEGRVPDTREAALVMLADAAEAAGRALPDTGPLHVEEAVRRVVDSKRADGQLAHSGMSDDDVERVTCVYAKMLMGMRHARAIRYPEPVERA